jgi:membrane protein YdbS with pleckstrin-like domain
MAKQGSKDAGKKDHMSAAAKKYLVEGEVVHWQGKPATIVILGRGLLLTVLSAIYIAALMLSTTSWISLATALVACLLMMVVDHRFGLLGGIAGIVILAALALGLSSSMKWLLAVPLAFAVISLLINVIYLGRVLFMITNQRIITRYGIFSLRYAELDIDRIQNVTVIQPWYERIFGYGDVYFATAGEKGGIDYEKPGIKLMTGGAVTWENVGKPFDVVHKVNVINYPTTTPAPSAPSTPPSSESIDEKLRKLNELKEKGLISEQEYQQKRSELLKNM